jgi:hypothetical protein
MERDCHFACRSLSENQLSNIPRGVIVYVLSIEYTNNERGFIGRTDVDDRYTDGNSAPHGGNYAHNRPYSNARAGTGEEECNSATCCSFVMTVVFLNALLESADTKLSANGCVGLSGNVE